MIIIIIIIAIHTTDIQMHVFELVVYLFSS